MHRWNRPALALLLLAAAGCAGTGMGSIGDVLGGIGGTPGTGDQLRGEVGWVDTRNRELEVASGLGSRTRLTYDSRTEVLYQNQRYGVGDLEVGDRVTARVRRGQQGGRVYAEQIYVEQVSRDRNGGDRVGVGSGRVQRFDGQVGRVDTRAGRFELRTSRGYYTVSLPYKPQGSAVSRFRRLHAGDRVRVEGELLAAGRVELSRFL
jgi:hypothetical protein